LEKNNLWFLNRSKKSIILIPKFAINNHEIDLVNEASFLGVILDEHLTWKSHIAQTSRKMSKSVGIIKNFENLFQNINQVHNYYTRNSKLYFLPFCRTNIRQFSINYHGVKFFNSLPQDVCEASSVFSFRKKLKEYLFNL
jgi:hypothetical protein